MFRKILNIIRDIFIIILEIIIVICLIIAGIPYLLLSLINEEEAEKLCRYHLKIDFYID